MEDSKADTLHKLTLMILLCHSWVFRSSLLHRQTVDESNRVECSIIGHRDSSLLFESLQSQTIQVLQAKNFSIDGTERGSRKYHSSNYQLKLVNNLLVHYTTLCAHQWNSTGTNYDLIAK